MVLANRWTENCDVIKILEKNANMSYNGIKNVAIYVFYSGKFLDFRKNVVVWKIPQISYLEGYI